MASPGSMILCQVALSFLSGYVLSIWSSGLILPIMVSTYLWGLVRSEHGNPGLRQIFIILFFAAGVARGVAGGTISDNMTGYQFKGKVRFSGRISEVSQAGPSVRVVVEGCRVEEIYGERRKGVVTKVALYSFGRQSFYDGRWGTRVSGIGVAKPLSLFGKFDLYKMNLLLTGITLRVNSSPGNLLFLDKRKERGVRAMARGRIIEAIDAKVPPGAGKDLLVTFMTGTRKFNSESRNILIDTGLAHLMAISGLHAGAAALLFLWITRYILALVQAGGAVFDANPISLLTGALSALFYAYLTGMAIPVMRATSMILFSSAGIRNEDRGPDFKPLFFAAFIILVSDPAAIVTISFIFSFSISAILILLFSPGSDLGRKPFRSLVAVSVSAYLLSVPLSFLFFRKASLTGFIYNLLFVPLFIPLIGLVIFWELLFLAGCNFLLPALSLLGKATNFLTGLLKALSHFTGPATQTGYLSPLPVVIYSISLFFITFATIPIREKASLWYR